MLSQNNPIVTTTHGKVNPVSVKTMDKLQEWRDKYHAEQTANKGKRKVYCHYIVSPTYADTADSVTDTAIAYLQNASKIMAYTAIRTAYINSGHPYLWTLLQSAHADKAIDGQTALVHDISTTEDSDYRNLLNVQDDSTTMQELKYHRDGMPYLKMTDTGKAVMDATKTATIHADYADCVSIAFMAIWERVDTFTTFSDIWQVRRYVYRAVNQYLHEQRKSISEQERFLQYIIFTDEDGNENERTTGQADKFLSAVVDESAIEFIVRFVCENIRRDARENMAVVLRARLAGLTTREIATARGHKNDRNTVRLMERARQILSTADGKTLLATLIG